MSNIPPEFLQLAQSAELYDQSEKIGEKFGLHIDQIGELDAEIRDVLEGASNSKDFVEHIAERLEIDKGRAIEITEEVNKEVFQAIRSLLQNQTEEENSAQQQQSTASFEKAGDLSIEQQGRDDNRPGSPAPTDLEQKDHILDSIENPQPGNEKISRKYEQTYVEPMMDHLLSTPAAQPMHKSALFSTGLPEDPIQPATPPQPVPKQAPETLIQPPAPTKRAGPDPYKEPIE
jgi:hypothetical protein